MRLHIPCPPPYCQLSLRNGPQLIDRRWANRPDSAGDRPTFKPRPQLEKPTGSELLLNINLRTTEPMGLQTTQLDAPRAIGITQPSTVFNELNAGRGEQWDCPHSPAAVHAWRDHVDALMPPMSPVVGLNDSGMNMPIHKRLRDGPSGSSYIMRPPRDLEYSTSGRAAADTVLLTAACYGSVR